MLSMDLNCKGITWVGNVFQKFEAMCLEVEDIVCQETTKYVENHVQTVGVTVKKIYAEVMQDLLPPSGDSTKGENPDSFLEQNNDNNYEKPKVASKKDPIEAKLLPSNELEVIPLKVTSEKDPIEKKLPLTEELEVIVPEGKDSSQLLHFPSLGPVEEECSNFSLGKNGAIEDPMKEKLPAKEILKKISQEGKEKSHAPLSSGFTNANNEKACDKLTKIGPSHFCLALSKETNGIDTCTTNNMTCTGSLKNGCELDGDCSKSETSMSSLEIGSSNDYDGELSNGDDSTEPDMEAIETLEKLEESCIMVNSNELGFTTQYAGNHRSYKKKQKKLQDTCASRMKSTEGQEYEQLAFWYGDIDTILDERIAEGLSLPAHSKELNLKKQPGKDFCESEWELL